MQRHHLALAGMLASLMLAGCSQPPPAAAGSASDAPSRRFGTIDFQPCTLSTEGASANVEAQCATLQVPENRAQPDGRRIGLRIAWLESGSSGASQPDPVFFLAGGPGQAASEVAVIVDTALRQVRKQRDVFLIDQRGTGGSNPLSCLGADGKPLQMDEDAAPSEASLRDYAQRCAASLQGRADARLYTTTEAIADLDAVRAALGVDQLNLVGGSYGTRVAQRYAGAYPQHTRSIVIDGVVPNELVVGGDFATTFEDAIALQSAQCRKDAACSKRFPTDTRAQLRSVVDTLRRAPVSVEYRDPGTNAPRQDVLTPDSVVGLAGRETAIGDAIGLAVKRLRSQPEGQRVLILLTDGVSNAGVLEPLRAAEVARAEGVRIHTVAFGGDGSMRLFGIPISTDQDPVDEATLKKIASMTGGQFFRARDTAQLAGIYAELDRLEPVAAKGPSLRPREERYAWPLGLALLLGVLAWLWPERRR